MYNGRSLLDDYKTALHGIVEIQEHFDLDTNDLARGRIKDFRTGKIYQSNSHLTSNELLEISKEAKNEDYLNNYVDWLNATLEQAIIEKTSSKYISKLRYIVRLRTRLNLAPVILGSDLVSHVERLQ